MIHCGRLEFKFVVRENDARDKNFLEGLTAGVMSICEFMIWDDNRKGQVRDGRQTWTTMGLQDLISTDAVAQSFFH